MVEGLDVNQRRSFIHPFSQVCFRLNLLPSHFVNPSNRLAAYTGLWLLKHLAESLLGYAPVLHFISTAREDPVQRFCRLNNVSEGHLSCHIAWECVESIKMTCHMRHQRARNFCEDGSISLCHAILFLYSNNYRCSQFISSPA